MKQPRKNLVVLIAINKEIITFLVFDTAVAPVLTGISPWFRILMINYSVYDKLLFWFWSQLRMDFKKNAKSGL